jgi:hypothetical protein
MAMASGEADSRLSWRGTEAMAHVATLLSVPDRLCDWKRTAVLHRLSDELRSSRSDPIAGIIWLLGVGMWFGRWWCGCWPLGIEVLCGRRYFK